MGLNRATMILATRRLRVLAFVLLAGFQLLIALTGLLVIERIWGVRMLSQSI